MAFATKDKKKKKKRANQDDMSLHEDLRIDL